VARLVRRELPKEYELQSWEAGIFATASIMFDDVPCRLRIWHPGDCVEELGGARSEQCREMYEKADLCILMFDVGSEASFLRLDLWLELFLLVEKRDPAAFPFVLVGNKADLHLPQAPREVTDERIAAWCKAKHLRYMNDIRYVSTSARDKFNLRKLMTDIVDLCLRQGSPVHARALAAVTAENARCDALQVPDDECEEDGLHMPGSTLHVACAILERAAKRRRTDAASSSASSSS
jgi:tRNA U34 5-carboxymethylaminomethyl modifying GTPase MnmE/TrmE